jgi:hypothetical protein
MDATQIHKLIDRETFHARGRTHTRQNHRLQPLRELYDRCVIEQGEWHCMSCNHILLLHNLQRTHPRARTHVGAWVGAHARESTWQGTRAEVRVWRRDHIDPTLYLSDLGSTEDWRVRKRQLASLPPRWDLQPSPTTPEKRVSLWSRRLLPNGRKK